MIGSRGVFLRLAVTAALATSVAGCALLRPAPGPPRLFVLEGAFDAVTPASDSAGRQSLLVPTPIARAGYDGTRIAYVTKAYELQFFAQSEWVDTPARMLAPLLVEALESIGRFQTVHGLSGVSASLRLDTEITTLQQEFASEPSRTRFGLRALLVDVVGRRVVAMREFETVETAPSDDPYGGVVAANVAVMRVLRELADWSAAQSPR